MATKPRIALTSILDSLARSRNDEEAWRSLYAQLWPYVMGLNYRFLGGDSDLAEDASQEVMIRLARYCKFEKLKKEDAFRAYVRTVCRNVCRRLLRRRLAAREVSLDELDLQRSEALLGEQAPDEELLAQELLGSAVDKLGPADRQLFTLLIGGFAANEITNITGLARGNVYVRVHRLRHKLRKLWHPNSLQLVDSNFGFDSGSKK
jgi:RNA polymerase sigma factor (sigma-70 family)